MAVFRVNVHKVRDSSAETKDVIKAGEEGAREDGKMTYSRLQEWERFGIYLKSEAEERFGIQACCVQLAADGVN